MINPENANTAVPADNDGVNADDREPIDPEQYIVEEIKVSEEELAALKAKALGIEVEELTPEQLAEEMSPAEVDETPANNIVVKHLGQGKDFPGDGLKSE